MALFEPLIKNSQHVCIYGTNVLMNDEIIREITLFPYYNYIIQKNGKKNHSLNIT